MNYKGYTAHHELDPEDGVLMAGSKGSVMW